ESRCSPHSKRHSLIAMRSGLHVRERGGVVSWAIRWISQRCSGPSSATFAETKMQASEQPGARLGDPVRTSASLDQLTGAPMPVQDFLVLALRLVDQLAALHARGAIHHDLRLSSIGFDAATGALALASPPLAEWRTVALSEGALPYISPEQ